MINLKTILAAFSLLFLVIAVLLVKPEGVSAQPNRSDLEERVASLEVEATLSRQHIQALESKVRSLESNADEGERDRSTSDLASSVDWIRQVYIPSTEADINKMDKRLKDLERDHFLELVCRRPIAKQKASSAQLALAKQDAALCRELGGTPN